MLIGMKETGEISEGRNSTNPMRVKIRDLDIDHNLSSRAQREGGPTLAELEIDRLAPKEEWQEWIERCEKSELTSVPLTGLMCNQPTSPYNMTQEGRSPSKIVNTD